MAEQIGKLVICDMCGHSEFVAYTGTDKYDGGYTVVDRFADLSEGWQYSSELSAKLCPTCGAAWEKSKKDYLNKYRVMCVTKEEL